MIEVREAVPDDADALADAHVEGWRVAYRGAVPDSHLDAPEHRQQRRAMWRAWTWNEHGRAALFVAVVDGRVAGFGLCGPQRADQACDRMAGAPADVARPSGEVYAFYLHPDTWGAGAALPLMRRCEAWLGDQGFADATLWVLGANPRARRFYEKAGWHATGREQRVPGPRCVAGVPEYSLDEVEYRTSLR